MQAKTLTQTIASWRTPAVVLACGCLIAMFTFGPRSSFGFFLTPMSSEHGWGRDVFALAFAIQNLLWGIGQPFAGAIADKFGTVRVLCTGIVLYAAGLALMTVSTTPITLDLTAGVLIGFGLSGCSFNIVLSAFGKIMKPEWRGLALGLGTAAGSFGQFLFAPFGVALIDGYGWQAALVVFACLLLLAVPLALALTTPPATSNAETGKQQSMGHALWEAFGHRSYVLLVLGFFTCGFQLAFVTAHLPSYLIDRGLDARVGGWTIAIRAGWRTAPRWTTSCAGCATAGFGSVTCAAREEGSGEGASTGLKTIGAMTGASSCFSTGLTTCGTGGTGWRGTGSDGSGWGSCEVP
jgi:MFS family permease